MNIKRHSNDHAAIVVNVNPDTKLQENEAARYWKKVQANYNHAVKAMQVRLFATTPTHHKAEQSPAARMVFGKR